MNIISFIPFSTLIIIARFFHGNLAAVKAPNYSKPNEANKLAEYFIKNGNNIKTHSFLKLLERRSMETIWKDIFLSSSTTLPCNWADPDIELSLNGGQYKPKVFAFYCSQNSANVDYNQYYITNGFIVNSVITVKRTFNLIKKQRNEVKYEPEALWFLSPDIVPTSEGQSQFNLFLNQVRNPRKTFTYQKEFRLAKLSINEVVALCKLTVGNLDSNVTGSLYTKDAARPSIQNGGNNLSFENQRKLYSVYCEGNKYQFYGIQDTPYSMFLLQYVNESTTSFVRVVFDIAVLDPLLTYANAEIRARSN